MTCAMKPEVDALMRNYAGDVPGAAVLVLRDGQPVVRATYGLADLEAGTPATPETNYRLASVTKQFTAASILLLAEDGRLTLDDRGRKWLPSLPKAAETVTIRHLLTHTSGLIDYEDVIPEIFAAQLHDADVLRLLETQDRTYFRPGTGYRYSNSGYALLALIAQRASGKTFATFLRERIFQPLGMNNTVAYEEGISTVNNRAFGYTEEAGRWNRTDQDQTSAVLGDGGIYSSIDDLAKWDAALYDGRLLTSELVTGGVHTRDAHRRSRDRVRLRLAHHRRDAVALRRDGGFPQCDRALPEAAHDGGRADQPERARAVPAGTGNRQDGYRFSIALIAGVASDPSARPMCWANAIIAANNTLCYRGLGANRFSDLSVIGFTPFG